jgi:predicted metal-dependent phosphoesterase TrpH
MIKDKYGNKYYKLGLHIHSTLSDGKKTPEEIAEIYKNCGYDAIALTDHWNYGEACEINGMPVISGCEYNLGVAETIEGVMHIVGLGMKKDPMIEKDADRQSVIDSIIAVGGIPVLAHPAWSLNSVDDAARLHGFVATEIYNAVSEAHESLRPYSDYFVDLCANAGIYYGLLATDDAHYYDVLRTRTYTCDIIIFEEEYMKDNNVRDIDAIDWIEYNTIRALPYMGENAPIICEGLLG